MRKYALSILACSAVLLAGCSFFDRPSADDAMKKLDGLVRNTQWDDVKVSGCSGGQSQMTCAVSYNRTTGGFKFYEELSMDFVKTPTGWTPQGYKVLQTQEL